MTFLPVHVVVAAYIYSTAVQLWYYGGEGAELLAHKVVEHVPAIDGQT